MWIKDYFSRQARKPSGLFGRFFMTRVFVKGNLALNRLMTGLVDADGNDQILEIGFGPGAVVFDMANALTDGMVEGIDFSDAMISVATKKNKHHISAGKVKLIHGNFDETEYETESFHTVCSSNTIYFWPDPEATLSRIFHVLKPGGSLVLAFGGKEKLKDMSLDMDVFTLYSIEDVQNLLTKSGFPSHEVHTANGPDSDAYCVRAHKPV